MTPQAPAASGFTLLAGALGAAVASPAMAATATSTTPLDFMPVTIDATEGASAVFQINDLFRVGITFTTDDDMQIGADLAGEGGFGFIDGDRSPDLVQLWTEPELIPLTPEKQSYDTANGLGSPTTPSYLAIRNAASDPTESAYLGFVTDYQDAGLVSLTVFDYGELSADVPGPAALPLLASGAAAIFALRRRRRQGAAA